MAMLLKPRSRKLELAEAKRERRIAKDKAKRAQRAEDAKVYEALRLEIYRRDLGLCRSCGMTVELHTSNIFKLAHLHHIVYRSAGGGDTPENLVILCASCHNDEHRHAIDITGTASALQIVRLQ